MAHRFGFTGSAAAPVRVHDSLWGALVVVTRHGALPPGMEERVVGRQARGTHLADESRPAARRRVVAHGAPLREVFGAVATEASTLLGVPPRPGTTPSSWRRTARAGGAAAAHGRRHRDRRRAADGAAGPGRHLRRHRGRVTLADPGAAGVAVPVVVEGRVWGMLSTSTAGPPVPAGTEARLAPLAELAAAAMLAENRAKLVASRARVVATADETRRRLQRDVHDSAQQRLVHTIITLKLAARRPRPTGTPQTFSTRRSGTPNARAADLRDVVRGILPGGPDPPRPGSPASSRWSRTWSLPVDPRVSVPRLPAGPRDHRVLRRGRGADQRRQARAREPRRGRRPARRRATLVLVVRDDGAGGADPARGTRPHRAARPGARPATAP